MEYFTESDFTERATLVPVAAAREQLRTLAASALGRYDVFLSHSGLDPVTLTGVRDLLLRQGLKVYVGWADGPHVNLSKVSRATASHLRERMNLCRTLIHATRRSDEPSAWMLWTLGYFDGANGHDRVAVLPVESKRNESLDGQDHLQLYKTVHKVETADGLTPRILTPTLSSQTLRAFANLESTTESGC